MGEAAFQKVAVNDLFHAVAPNGASLICRAVDVDAEYIHAKTVTTHWNFIFSRQDGRFRFDEDGIVSVIDSVAPLPTDIDMTIRGLKHKGLSLNACGMVVGGHGRMCFQRVVETELDEQPDVDRNPPRAA